MRVLLVDTSLDGHHMPYLLSIVEKLSSNYMIMIPHKIAEVPDKFQIINNSHISTLFGYLAWIRQIKQVLKTGDYDIVHFLYGDVMYRYFGLGLSFPKNIKTVATFHQIRYSRLRNLSIRRIYRKIGTGIVHTEHLYDFLRANSIQNCVRIEYPVFETVPHVTDKQRHQLRTSFGIKDKDVAFLALGATRKDKGLDILLKAMQNLDGNFHLCIAGAESDISKEQIDQLSKPISAKITVDLRYLSEAEMCNYVLASDVVALPYRRIFDGASGPLGLGVIASKCIIGPSHGSLGQIVKANHLGYTFETENIQDLYLTVRKAMENSFSTDSSYCKYRKNLSVKTFVQKNLEVYREMLDPERKS